MHTDNAAPTAATGDGANGNRGRDRTGAGYRR
jgi:hypothetical protein